MPSGVSVLAAPLGFMAVALVALALPAVLRYQSARTRQAAALAGAAGAAFAGAHPTAIPAADVLLTAAFAGGVVFVAGRSRPWPLAASAVLAAVASGTSDIFPLAHLAAGAALAIALTSRRARFAVPLLALAVVQVALRLEVQAFAGASSLAAAAALAPMTISGYLALPSSQRRWTRRVTLAAGAALTLGGLAGAVAAAAARPHLDGGLDAARAGVGAARAGNQRAADRHFSRAADALDRAGAVVGAPWALPGRAVPVVAQHLRAVAVVSEVGADLSAAGRGITSAADLAGLRVTGGVVPLDALAALRPPLQQATAQALVAGRRLGEGQSPWLVPPLRRRLQAEVERLGDAQRSLETAAAAVDVLPALLGADRPRRYFLAVQTASEIRGTGGFIGNYGEVTADAGKLTLTRFGRLRELNEGGTAARRLTGPEDYQARYGRFAPETTWQNVNMSPDFPSVTEVIAGLYPQSGGRPIDGAIALDPAGLAALLSITGPVPAEPLAPQLTATNAEQLLMFDQYVRFEGQERIDILGAATGRVVERLVTGELPPMNEILDALGPAVAEKHLMVSATDPAERDALVRLGLSGRMAPVRGDFLAAVAQNASGNKIDWFLRREIDYRATVDPASGALEATAAITLRNEAPATGLPPVIIGNAVDPPLPSGTSRLYLSVYTPWLLRGATLDGRTHLLESQRELGRNVYSLFVDIGPGATRTLTLSLRGTYRGSKYHLDVHRQPSAAPDLLRVDVDTGATGVAGRVEQRSDRRFG